MPDEEVMPKYSLTCRKYEVLAELNKIRVNGQLIKDAEMKNQIINDLFMRLPIKGNSVDTTIGKLDLIKVSSIGLTENVYE